MGHFLFVFDTNAGQWFLIFMELRARGSLEDMEPKNHAEHVKRLVQEAPGSQKTGAEGLLEALKEERDCFLLYLTNAGGQSTANELAIVLKEQDTSNFFGPL